MTALMRQTITMADGLSVTFPARQATRRSFHIDDSGNAILRVDFRSGRVEVLTLTSDHPLHTPLAALGALSRVTQAMAGLDDDDALAACKATLGAIAEGKMPGESDPTTSYRGAGIVLRALAEVKGITVEQARELVETTLAKAEADGRKLTRQGLYAAFRTPGSKTAPVIVRLEAERDAELAETARVAVAAAEVDNLLDSMDPDAQA